MYHLQIQTYAIQIGRALETILLLPISSPSMAIPSNAHAPADQMLQDRAVLVADICSVVEQLKEALVTKLMDFKCLVPIIAPVDHGIPPSSTCNPGGMQLLQPPMTVKLNAIPFHCL
jgi:hypothetical protein